MPVVLLTSAIIAIACYLPASPMGSAFGMVHLPPAFWPFLAATVLAYCLLTQVVKNWFIKKFHEWL